MIIYKDKNAQYDQWIIWLRSQPVLLYLTNKNELFNSNGYQDYLLMTTISELQQ